MLETDQVKFSTTDCSYTCYDRSSCRHRTTLGRVTSVCSGREEVHSTKTYAYSQCAIVTHLFRNQRIRHKVGSIITLFNPPRRTYGLVCFLPTQVDPYVLPSERGKCRPSDFESRFPPDVFVPRHPNACGQSDRMCCIGPMPVVVLAPALMP